MVERGPEIKPALAELCPQLSKIHTLLITSQTILCLFTVLHIPAVYL